MSSDIGKHEVIKGEVPFTLQSFPDNHFHACVTDAPYGLAFMGNDWDDFEPKEYQQFCEEWSKEVLRVLKPGGHMLSFSGNRTHHRAMVGIEDAGFTVRDTITYLYGTGMPKGLAVDKALDEKLGKEGEYGDPKTDRDANEIENLDRDVSHHDGYHRPWMDDPDAKEKASREYIPATEVAQRFKGAKTGLKPSTEFVCVARKPLEEDTIVEQILSTETGALNIRECRIPTENKEEFPEGVVSETEEVYGNGEGMHGDGVRTGDKNPNSRYPANLALDEKAAELLDEQSGVTRSPDTYIRSGNDTNEIYGEGIGDLEGQGDVSVNYGDSGGASRFFYTSKASRSEKTVGGKVDHSHPTVKPIDLMEWLVKLVTAEGQRVLDPFLGSGTTPIACENTRRGCVGIERDEEYAELARDRLAASRGRLTCNEATDW